MDTLLPSKIEGIDFTATVRAAWISDDPDISRQRGYALAMEHLWREAKPIAQQWYAVHHEAAQAAVNAVVDPRVTLESAPIAVSGNVTLTASAQAVSATRDYLALRRDEEIRRERTGAQLRELRRALKSPGLAQLWWVSNNPEHLAAITSPAFEELVTVIANAGQEDLTPQTAIEQVLLKFTSELTSPQDRQYLLRVFKEVLMQFDKSELLKELG